MSTSQPRGVGKPKHPISDFFPSVPGTKTATACAACGCSTTKCNNEQKVIHALYVCRRTSDAVRSDVRISLEAQLYPIPASPLHPVDDLCPVSRGRNSVHVCNACGGLAGQTATARAIHVLHKCGSTSEAERSSLLQRMAEQNLEAPAEPEARPAKRAKPSGEPRGACCGVSHADV